MTKKKYGTIDSNADGYTSKVYHLMKDHIDTLCSKPLWLNETYNVKPKGKTLCKLCKKIMKGGK